MDFTPGPWYWDSDNGWLVANDPGDEMFGFIVLALDRDNARIDVDPDETDARLIAASPQLYRALKSLLSRCDSTDWDYEWSSGQANDVIEKAAAALALVDKATQ